jgi:hypothetical protein
MACTFIALFANAATARRAKDDLSAVTGVDRAYEPNGVESLIDDLRVAPNEARELREGARRGEKAVVIQLWSADPTPCEVLETMAGANLLIPTERAGDNTEQSGDRPHVTIESIRSDLYIG